MKFGIFELKTTYSDNGILGDGYKSWITGTELVPQEEVSTEQEAINKCEILSKKNPKNTFLYMRIFKGNS